MCRSPSSHVIALHPCCYVMTLPPVSFSRRYRLSPKNTRRYGSMISFRSAFMSLHCAVCFSQLTVRRLSQMGAGIVKSVADRGKSSLWLFGGTAAPIQGDMVSVFFDTSWTVSLSFSRVSIPTSCHLVGLLLNHIIACCAALGRQSCDLCSVPPHR
jgi:hypothetical protein